MARFVVPLPIWEQSLYWLVQLYTLCCFFFTLYNISDVAWRTNEPIHLENGLLMNGRPMDVADFEWTFWTSYIWTLLPWVFGHMAVSFFCTRFVRCLRLRRIILSIYGVLAISNTIGFYTILLFSMMPLLLYLVSFYSNVRLVWITAVILLTAFNLFEKFFLQWFYSYNADNLEDWFYVRILTWSMLFQRATSFAIENAWACKPVIENISTTGSNSENIITKTYSHSLPHLSAKLDFVDFFLYMFYFPLFFTGPLLIYRHFHDQVRRPLSCTKERTRHVLVSLGRILLWALFYTIILHYFYAHAINKCPQTMLRQSRWCLAAIAYFLGQFFMVKYLVLFGVSTQLARLDGFEPPFPPACVSYVYCYTDMWKYFDRGFYQFLMRYIFIPVGGSQHGLVRQITGSILCFAYIFYWHGAEVYLLCWCVVNFAESCLENVGKWLECNSEVKRLIIDRLSPAAMRRLRAILSVPLCLMSVFAILYFFGGTTSGSIFFNKLLLTNSWTSIMVLYLLMYCAVQNAMEIERLGLRNV